MKTQLKWAIVPLLQIEDAVISMKNRYSISESIYDIIPEQTFHYDTLERDGLGAWHIVVFEASDGSVVMFGNAASEDCENGATVWTNVDYSLDEATEIIRSFFPRHRVAVISAE